MTPQCWELGGRPCSKGWGGGPKWGEKGVSGARTGAGESGEDAPLATGAVWEQEEAQGVPNAKVCLTARPSPCQPCAQPQERAEKPQGTGAKGRLPNFLLEAEPQGVCSPVPPCKGDVPPQCTPMHTHACAHTHRGHAAAMAELSLRPLSPLHCQRG